MCAGVRQHEHQINDVMHMDETGSSRRRRSNSSSGSTSPIAINTFSSPTFPTISQEVLLCAIRSGAGDAAAACSNSFTAAAAAVLASPLGFFSLFSRHFSFFSFFHFPLQAITQCTHTATHWMNFTHCRLFLKWRNGWIVPPELLVFSSFLSIMKSSPETFAFHVQ